MTPTQLLRSQQTKPPVSFRVIAARLGITEQEAREVYAAAMEKLEAAWKARMA
jgi:hypothetical protein